MPPQTPWRIAPFVALLSALIIVTIGVVPSHSSGPTGYGATAAAVDQSGDGSSSLPSDSSQLPGPPAEGHGGSGVAGPGRTVQLPPRSATPPRLSAQELGELEQALERSHLPEPPVPEDPTAIKRSDPPSVPETRLPEQELSMGTASANDLVLFRSATVTVGTRSTTNEPSVAGNGNHIFYTGNWYAALSTDSGNSFTFVDPRTQLPSSYGGFCCDQVAIYDPSRNLTIWLLQYFQDSAGNNAQRIAVARGQDGLRNNVWTYWDITAQAVGWPSGYWLDYPHLALGANYLYLTTNIFYMSNPTSSGTGIVRVSLDSLAAGGQLAYSYYSESNVSGFAPTAGAATTMYFARHRSSTLLRLYTWPESGDWTAITYTDVSHSSYRQGSPGEVACSSPDGTNMCGYDDSRLKAGWVAGGVIGFMWGAAQGSGSLGNFPYPYVHVVRIGEASKTLIDEPVIWNSAFAWAYPGLGVNGRGHLGVSLAYAGGGRYPGSSVIVRDDITASSGSPFWQSLGVRSGTHGPGTNRWGDYLSVRPASGNGNTWVGTAFTLQGACPGPYSNCANVEPRFLWFGRQRDDPFATPTPTATRTPTSTATPTPTLTRTPTRTPTGIPVTPGATQVALTSVAGVRVDLPVVPTPAGGTGAVRMAISVSPPDVIPSSMPGRQRKLRAIFVHLTTNGVANHTPLPQPARVSLDFTRADLLPGENPLAVKLYLTSNGRDWEQLTDTQVTDLAAATTGRPPARRTSASSSWQETRPGSTSRRSAARRRAGGSLRHAAGATRQKKPWMDTDERR